MPRGDLRIVAPFLCHSGYSKMARAVLRSAILAGYRVQAVQSDLYMHTTGWNEDGLTRVTQELNLPPIVVPLPDCQYAEVQECMKVRVADNAPTLMMQLPGNLSHWNQYGHTPCIGWTMTESDNLCEYWKHGLRCVDLAIAPSEYVGNTFKRVVPETPSIVCPIPVDDRLWMTDEYVDRPRDAPPFLFLSIFSTNLRKNWMPMMLAFAEEFKDEKDKVGLVVKPTREVDVLQFADFCKEMGAWVYVDRLKRTDWALGALYRACDVYVQPASEGFGLPYIEAGMCGLPSIALDKSGSADVVNEETGYLVPSFMAGLPCHMPNVYDRKEHLFASFEIDDLRIAMRRAYIEEAAGAAKGKEARHQYMEKFTCEAVAPKIVDAVERGIARYWQNAMTYPERPRWATVAGAWGDVFCCIGTIRKMMQDKELQSIGIIYFGKDAKIADWLRIQPWCREVLTMVEPEKKPMERIYAKMCQVKPHHAPAEFQKQLSLHGLVVNGDIAYTQLCLNQERECDMWHGAEISDAARQWAYEIVERVREQTGQDRFILLNPLSIASNTFKDHWPHWSEAVGWLVDVSPLPLVMVSEKEIAWPDHPNLVNVTGQSRSMQDVLALADRCAGMVSTSNNLGHWAWVQEIPSVIVCAKTCGKETFYHRAMRQENISIVDFNEPITDLQRAVLDRFKDLFTPEQAEELEELGRVLQV